MADNKSCEDNKRSIGELTIDLDAEDALKGLKAIQREARKAVKELKEVETLTSNKYLVIELNELGDVPRVLYKGEEITLKEFINFQWTTKSNEPGNTDVIVDYFKNGERKSIREGVSS